MAADIRRVTDTFAVAPQLQPEEVEEAAGQGYKLLINNRPDGESPDQPPSTAMAMAARRAGMDYLHIPISGGAGPGQVEAMHQAIAGASGPVLAFCRSGTRSVTVWARGQAQAGDRPREELLKLGRGAGYDLSASL
jgi:uncharacterized protein (TIGR01244 family)